MQYWKDLNPWKKGFIILGALFLFAVFISLGWLRYVFLVTVAIILIIWFFYKSSQGLSIDQSNQKKDLSINPIYNKGCNNNSTYNPVISNNASNYDPVYRQKDQFIKTINIASNQGKCPRCGSVNLQALNQQVKVTRGAAYTFFMAFLFIISFGILWLLLGMLKKKVIQTYIVCLNCGYKWLI